MMTKSLDPDAGLPAPARANGEGSRTLRAGFIPLVEGGVVTN